MKEVTPFIDIEWMELALKEAFYAFEKDEVPIGVVIISQERVIARGYNLTEGLNDVTAHAEMQAITAAADFLGGKYLHGCTLYVTLEPCVMCAGALYWSQISRVVFGASDPKRGFLKAGVQLHPRTSLTTGELEMECRALLQDFFRSKRK
ncbi:MAG: nucleoside deaminase [Flavobacteriales bacterium AspAUS03]